MNRIFFTMSLNSGEFFFIYWITHYINAMNLFIVCIIYTVFGASVHVYIWIVVKISSRTKTSSCINFFFWCEEKLWGWCDTLISYALKLICKRSHTNLSLSLSFLFFCCKLALECLRSVRSTSIQSKIHAWYTFSRILKPLKQYAVIWFGQSHVTFISRHFYKS